MADKIAIVGMSCRFAGINSPAALWDAVMRQRCMFTELGREVAMPFGQQPIFRRSYPVCMGQLGKLYSCVPSMQHFPRQVNVGENQDLYFATQLAFDALSDASVKLNPPEPFRGTVRLGYAPPFNASTVNWLQHTVILEQTLDILRRFLPHAPEESIGYMREKLLEKMPEPNAASFLLGSGYRFVSWIARECSFAGAATIMDAGMISGAATLEDAIDDLVSGRADISLAGALTPPLSRAIIEGMAGEVQFSTRNELMPFSEGQAGTIPGEGGAFFVLKREQDALDAHDRIYALLRSVAIGHNPKDDPSAIFAQALDMAGAATKSVGLIEADGTGIAESEAREVAGVQKLWGEHKPGGPLVGMGSVKGNIGHTFRSSMAAGVMKAALALYHRVLPPQIPAERPLESASNLASSVYLLNAARPWLTGDTSSPRRAAVMGANFDSVNPIGNSSPYGRSAVVILEEELEARA